MDLCRVIVRVRVRDARVDDVKPITIKKEK